MSLFLLPTGYSKSLCYSLLPPYDKLKNVENKSIVTDFQQQKQYLKAILRPRNPCNTFASVIFDYRNAQLRYNCIPLVYKLLPDPLSLPRASGL